MFYLHYLCLLAYSGVQNKLCPVFLLFFVVLCTICCQFIWIGHFVLPLRYSLTFFELINMFIQCQVCLYFSIYQYVYLLSHTSPEYPSVQSHVKFSPPVGMQVALFRQGGGSQLLSSKIKSLYDIHKIDIKNENI